MNDIKGGTLWATVGALLATVLASVLNANQISATDHYVGWIAGITGGVSLACGAFLAVRAKSKSGS